MGVRKSSRLHCPLLRPLSLLLPSAFCLLPAAFPGPWPLAPGPWSLFSSPSDGRQLRGAVARPYGSVKLVLLRVAGRLLLGGSDSPGDLADLRGGRGGGIRLAVGVHRFLRVLLPRRATAGAWYGGAVPPGKRREAYSDPGSRGEDRVGECGGTGRWRHPAILSSFGRARRLREGHFLRGAPSGRPVLLVLPVPSP